PIRRLLLWRPMRMQLVGHACVVLYDKSGRSLVCDPWIHEPVFASRWYRYPPQDLTAIPRAPDWLCLSHAHPDHAGSKTLRAFTPGKVVTCQFPTAFLSRRTRAIFGDRLVELPSFRRLPLVSNSDDKNWVAVVANDRGWEDASFVISIDGVTV